jgi:hypothetical protein
MTTTGDVPVRLLAAAGAMLAVLPVGAFLLLQAMPSVTLALVNVALIAGSLYYLFGPVEGDHEHATEPAP